MRVTALLLIFFSASTSAQGGWRSSSPERLPAPIGPSASRADGWREERDIRERIRSARDSGQITRQAARGLRREARANTALSDRLAQDGVSAAERRELDARAFALRDRLTARRTIARP